MEEAESAHSAERNKAPLSINEAFHTVTMSETENSILMHYLVTADQFFSKIPFSINNFIRLLLYLISQLMSSQNECDLVKHNLVLSSILYQNQHCKFLFEFLEL